MFFLKNKILKVEKVNKIFMSEFYLDPLRKIVKNRKHIHTDLHVNTYTFLSTILMEIDSGGHESWTFHKKIGFGIWNTHNSLSKKII